LTPTLFLNTTDHTLQGKYTERDTRVREDQSNNLCAYSTPKQDFSKYGKEYIPYKWTTKRVPRIRWEQDKEFSQTVCTYTNSVGIHVSSLIHVTFDGRNTFGTDLSARRTCHFIKHNS
jgi:hypothetical protein